jgi:hypothetical protein
VSASIGGFRVPRLALVAIGFMLGLAVFSSAAQACSYPDAAQVFSRWEDNSYYELAPDGGFEEGGTGWTFRGGAQLVAGNESEYLNGPEDKTSLSLPSGSSVTSPRVCVDENTPGFRLMTANGGAWSSKLRVTVSYELPGENRSRDTELHADDEWSPTQVLKLEYESGKERVARITLAPRDEKGAWLIDDLYIDPWARH